MHCTLYVMCSLSTAMTSRTLMTVRICSRVNIRNKVGDEDRFIMIHAIFALQLFTISPRVEFHVSVGFVFINLEVDGSTIVWG